MKNTFPLIVILILTSVSFITHAEMYKWVDDEGNISYSDQPPEKNSKALEPPALTPIPSFKLPAKTIKKELPEEKITTYTKLVINSPKHNGTIHNNEGAFSISFSSKPALDIKQGDYFTVSLNNKTTHKNHLTTSASFKNIDRGTHTIMVRLKGKKGKTKISSSPITLHLQRHSVLKNKKPQPPTAPK